MRNRCNFARWRVILLAFLLLSGCGSAPSGSEVERALAQGDPLIGKVYLIRNINRINGYERPDGYVVEFGAEIHLLEKPTEYFGRLAKEDKTGIGVLTAMGLAAGGLAKWGLRTAAAISAAEKGEVVPFLGSVTMIRSERGWILRPE